MKKLIILFIIISEAIFSISSKENNDLGLKAYKEMNYNKAINYFYLSAVNSKDPQYYSDYALALIKGGLLEHGVFIALYSNELTDDKRIKASNFYNIHLALENYLSNLDIPESLRKPDIENYDKVEEDVKRLSQLSKEISVHLKDNTSFPKLEYKNVKEMSLIEILILDFLLGKRNMIIKDINLEKEFNVKLQIEKESLKKNIDNEEYLITPELSKIFNFKTSFIENLKSYGEVIPSRFFSFNSPTYRDLENFGLEKLKFPTFYGDDEDEWEAGIDALEWLVIQEYEDSFILDYKLSGQQNPEMSLYIKKRTFNLTSIEPNQGDYKNKVLRNWKTGETDLYIYNQRGIGEYELNNSENKVILKTIDYQLKSQSKFLNKEIIDYYLNESQGLSYSLWSEFTYTHFWFNRGSSNNMNNLEIDINNDGKLDEVSKGTNWTSRGWPYFKIMSNLTKIERVYYRDKDKLPGKKEIDFKGKSVLLDLFFIEVDDEVIIYYLYHDYSMVNPFEKDKFIFLGVKYIGEDYEVVDKVEVKPIWKVEGDKKELKLTSKKWELKTRYDVFGDIVGKYMNYTFSKDISIEINSGESFWIAIDYPGENSKKGNKYHIKVKDSYGNKNTYYLNGYKSSRTMTIFNEGSTELIRKFLNNPYIKISLPSDIDFKVVDLDCSNFKEVYDEYEEYLIENGYGGLGFTKDPMTNEEAQEFLNKILSN